MPQICPKCGAQNRTGRSTCAVCGAELELALFAEMFGPPPRLKERYVVQRALKQGTPLSLYRAVDAREGNRPCLVHQISLTAGSPHDREMVEHHFLQEAIAWTQRRHPNLIEILDADVQHHRLYLITGPIRGRSLRSIIRDRQQRVSEETLLRWVGQMCDLLAYLHAQDPPAILGCLSPGSFHLDQEGRVQLVEVGLTRYKRSGLIGPARGIPGYAAPEQRRGEATPQSDLYSLGIIAYEIATRFDPKARPLPSLRKYASGHGGAPGLSGPGLSDHSVRAITRAYRRDPAKRPASAAEMRQSLMLPDTLLGEAAVPDAVGLAEEVDLKTAARPDLAPAEVRLPPIAFDVGQRQVDVHTLRELVRFCAAHWDEGLQALINGRIAEWLSDGAGALRAEGQDEAADQVRAAAERATLAAEKAEGDAARPGRSEAAIEIAHNAAFAAWLQGMGTGDPTVLGIRPSMEVRPQQFDFGVVGPKIVARSTLHIRNGGGGYLTGRVEGGLPWLTVPEPAFGCRAGETAHLRVEARGRRLPSGSGEATSPQALHVLSNGGTAWIEARASSLPPELSVEPRTLDYGPITRGALRVTHLRIANRGGGRLKGRVIAHAPWLRVRHPGFNCTAGASAQVAVELLSEGLPKGAVRIRHALAVDSDSGQAGIDVAWQWARPGLELDTTGLDMGSLERGARIARTLTLSNSGTADLVGQARSQVEWLTVQPAEFRVAPGASQPLTLACDTSSLPGGSTVEAAAVLIQANAGPDRPRLTETLSASIEVLAPRLVVEPHEIDLGTIADGDPVEETVMVGNQGSLPWTGQARANVPWLTVDPEEIHCPPGHFLPVTAMLHSEGFASGGEWTVEDAIQIAGSEGTASEGERRAVAMHVALVRPELEVERSSLPFGMIGRTDIVSRSLKVTNAGTGELEWRIEVQGTWLETVPNSGTCGSGETTNVRVNAYALAVEGETDQAWLTVRSNGGRADLPASVALSSPLLAVEPLWLDLHSENHSPASQTIRVSNRGVGHLRGTVRVQVPWLQIITGEGEGHGSSHAPAEGPQAATQEHPFALATGAATEIQVHANLEGLPKRAHGGSVSAEATEALVVESDSPRPGSVRGTASIHSQGERQRTGQPQRFVVGARLSLTLRPKLHVSPQVLHVERMAVDAQTEDPGTTTVLRLENQGYGTLRAQVLPTEPWIMVSRQEWTIKAGKTVKVGVRVTAPPEDQIVGQVSIPDLEGCIEIRTPDGTVRVPVRTVVHPIT